MTTLKLDSGGDLAIENGSLVLLDNLLAETSQRIAARFNTNLGEWHLDTRVGFPLFTEVFVKNPSLAQLRVLCRETIEEDEGVETLDELEIDFDTPTRTLSLTFSATLIDGSVLDVADFVLEENQ